MNSLPTRGEFLIGVPGGTLTRHAALRLKTPYLVGNQHINECFQPPCIICPAAQRRPHPGLSVCAGHLSREAQRIFALRSSGIGRGCAARLERFDRLGQDSSDGVTAVNADGNTGDKIGCWRRQKNSRSGTFVGITKTSGWRPCDDFLVQG